MEGEDEVLEVMARHWEEVGGLMKMMQDHIQR